MKTKHISTAIMGTVLLLLFTALPAYANGVFTPFDNPVGGLGLLLFVSCIVGYIVSLLVRVIIAFGRKKSLKEGVPQPETAEEEAALNIKIWTAVITLLLAVGLVCLFIGGISHFSIKDICACYIIVGCVVFALVGMIIAFGKESTKQSETAEEKAALNKKRRIWTAVISLLLAEGLMCLFAGVFRGGDPGVAILLFVILSILGYVGARAATITLFRIEGSTPQLETANAETSESAQNKEETKEETK